MRYVVGLLGIVLVASTAAAQDAKVEQGQKVYATQKCNACHTPAVAGKGNAKGPLENIGAKLSADEIRQWIVSASEMAKKAKATRKPLMKDYAKLPKEEVDALVAYLQTLKKG